MRELRDSGKLAIAFLLTAVGGFVDAFGYIALFQIFTANMSGNSVHVGIGIGRMDGLDLLRPVCAIAAYLSGLIVARIAHGVAARRGISRVATATLGMEAALLFCFAQATPAMHFGQVANLESAGYFALVALLAFSMGLQVATLTRIGPLTIYTTFVTGNLTKFSESLTRSLFWSYDQLAARNSISHIVRHAPEQQDFRETATLAGVWISYVAGAALGTWGKGKWEFHALYVPISVLLLLIAIDRFRPIAVEEMLFGTDRPSS